MRGRDLEAEQPESQGRPAAPAAPEHAVLALQREAGNAAVSRLLQRDDAPGFSPVRPGAQLGMRPTPPSVLDYAPAALPEHGAAVNAVVTWFRAAAAEITSGRSAGFFQSVPELVKAAGELTWNADGKTGKVSEQMRPPAIETLLRDATVIEAPSAGGRVDLGSKVSVEEVGVPGETIVYELVGTAEADPGKGRISNASPVGRALIGRRAGETVAVRTPRGDVEYRIIEVG